MKIKASSLLTSSSTENGRKTGEKEEEKDVFDSDDDVVERVSFSGEKRRSKKEREPLMIMTPLSFFKDKKKVEKKTSILFASLFLPSEKETKREEKRKGKEQRKKKGKGREREKRGEREKVLFKRFERKKENPFKL